MAFAPSASWNSRSITHLANYLSPSLPMIFSDESKNNPAGDPPKGFPTARLLPIVGVDCSDAATIGVLRRCQVRAQQRGPARHRADLQQRSKRAGVSEMEAEAPEREEEGD